MGWIERPMKIEVRDVRALQFVFRFGDMYVTKVCSENDLFASQDPELFVRTLINDGLADLEKRFML